MSAQNKSISELLTTTQAAKVAGKNVRTIVSWIHSGKLSASRLPGGRGPYLIDPDDLSAFLTHMSTPIPYEPKEKPLDGH
jgi:excisionase family DNA binding protein